MLWLQRRCWRREMRRRQQRQPLLLLRVLLLRSMLRRMQARAWWARRRVWMRQWQRSMRAGDVKKMRLRLRLRLRVLQLVLELRGTRGYARQRRKRACETRCLWWIVVSGKRRPRLQRWQRSMRRWRRRQR